MRKQISEDALNCPIAFVFSLAGGHICKESLFKESAIFMLQEC